MRNTTHRTLQARVTSDWSDGSLAIALEEAGIAAMRAQQLARKAERKAREAAMTKSDRRTVASWRAASKKAEKALREDGIPYRV